MPRSFSSAAFISAGVFSVIILICTKPTPLGSIVDHHRIDARTPRA